jgi:hypothetical protein
MSPVYHDLSYSPIDRGVATARAWLAGNDLRAHNGHVAFRPIEIHLRNASDLPTLGAGEGNRTLMTSLEGWGSAIELRPRDQAGTAGQRRSRRVFRR